MQEEVLDLFEVNFIFYELLNGLIYHLTLKIQSQPVLICDRHCLIKQVVNILE